MDGQRCESFAASPSGWKSTFGREPIRVICRLKKCAQLILLKLLGELEASSGLLAPACNCEVVSEAAYLSRSHHHTLGGVRGAWHSCVEALSLTRGA